MTEAVAKTVLTEITMKGDLEREIVEAFILRAKHTLNDTPFWHCGRAVRRAVLDMAREPVWLAIIKEAERIGAHRGIPYAVS